MTFHEIGALDLEIGGSFIGRMMKVATADTVHVGRL